MKARLNALKSLFIKLKSQIAFFPSMMAISAVFFGIFMFWAETQGISKWLESIAPALSMQNADSAKTLATVCISGIISIMVFSFSMVMLLLSQSSSNFSPRLLPGLISDQRNQLVLGTYLATVVFGFFTLFSVEPNGKEYLVPGFSVILLVAATLFCLVTFIFFIHTISQSIQVGNILDDIKTQAQKRLENRAKVDGAVTTQHRDLFKGCENWHERTLPFSSYYQDFARVKLHDFAKENRVRLYLCKPKGAYVWSGQCFVKTSRLLTDDEVDQMMKYFSFNRTELIEQNYALAFKQITEVIVKAMSPGINDPGTAINGLDYLIDLFAMRMTLFEDAHILENEEVWVREETVEFADLLQWSLAEICCYGKQDPLLMLKLAQGLAYLRTCDAMDEVYQKTVEIEHTKVLDYLKSVDLAP